MGAAVFLESSDAKPAFILILTGGKLGKLGVERDDQEGEWLKKLFGLTRFLKILR